MLEQLFSEESQLTDLLISMLVVFAKIHIIPERNMFSYISVHWFL